MAQFRETTYQFLHQLISCKEDELLALLEAHLTPDSHWHVCYPIETLDGPEQICRELILPIRRALPECLDLFNQMRVDLIEKSNAL